MEDQIHPFVQPSPSNSSPDGLTTLITGASCGIGLELAKVFARQGHGLVLVARDESRLNQLAGELRTKYGIKTKVIVKDLALATAAQEIAEELRGEKMAVEILVNNAGFGDYGDFAQAELAKLERIIQVNLLALTQLTHLMLPEMIRRGRGRILNVCSTASLVAAPYLAVYGATKAYVRSFSEAIAEELAGRGVTVTLLIPGPTKTEFQERARMSDVKLFDVLAMDAAVVAEDGYRALMAGRRTVVSGLGNRAQAVLIRLMPRIAVIKATRWVMKRKPAPDVASAQTPHP